MASTVIACDPADDDYIDMEVSSYSNFFCHSSSSHTQPREFEFQMSSIVQEKETTTSPADELFYKGKLLPLHLPPRLQMVEKLLQNSNSPFDKQKDIYEEFYSTPLATTTYTTPITGTPFESCNISPSESCQVSRELNPEEYYDLDYQPDRSGLVVENQKKSWTKKLKQSSLGSKLKASRAYLRSWFGKSGCSYETYATSTKVADEGSVSKAREILNKNAQMAKKNPYGQIQRDRYQSSNSVMSSYKVKTSEDGSNHHRRSFSVGIKLLSGNKTLSTSSVSSSSAFSLSNKSYGCQARQLLKRCSSANSDIENSIQGAIAHCKNSQQMFSSKKTTSEVGLYSLSASRTSVCEDQEREALCRG
ncbi:probable membrane-associated kinase regulator 4 [Gastrolobium bilobum]|uniref:probable membrane-associated kinase regulator 4 n=1 Tax=Gastrolobium bilobum TaxID=150636 RepID=UPI002AAF5FE0|nr:probable membrane-associated kinase regulator 4 [Gastrolobium bilobum]